MAAFNPPPALGRGGKEHKYLQNLIKEFAISKGYHAVIEEQILDGAGRVDVALSRESLKVACEISVTTGRDHEFGNLEKCLAAGYTHLVFVSTDARHVRAMDTLANAHFEEHQRAKMHFVNAEDALALIATWSGGSPNTTIRGYKVKTTTASLDQEETNRRRDAIASLLARSLLTKRSE
jgi:hypothetical protein